MWITAFGGGRSSNIVWVAFHANTFVAYEVVYFLWILNIDPFQYHQSWLVSICDSYCAPNQFGLAAQPFQPIWSDQLQNQPWAAEWRYALKIIKSTMTNCASQNWFFQFQCRPMLPQQLCSVFPFPKPEGSRGIQGFQGPKFTKGMLNPNTLWCAFFRCPYGMVGYHNMVHLPWKTVVMWDSPPRLPPPTSPEIVRTTPQKLDT